jgi:hypothetical protein
VFQPSIDVIRAVHSDRIRRDVNARHRSGIPARSSAFRAVRRAIGRSIVRMGARIAAEPATEHALDLAGSR